MCCELQEFLQCRVYRAEQQKDTPQLAQGPQGRKSLLPWPLIRCGHVQVVDLVRELMNRGLTQQQACAFLDSAPPLSLQVW